MASEIEVLYGATVQQLSAKWGLEDGPRGGDRRVIGGYRSVVEDMLDGIDVLTGNVVAQVSSTPDGVSIRIATGESLQVDRVIVTVSLGVLKSGDIRFEPALPSVRRAIIGDLGMGRADRVWLRYDEPFWTTDAVRWQAVGSDSAITEWVNLEPITGAPVLVGLVGAQHAVALAAMSDDDVRELARLALGPFVDG